MNRKKQNEILFIEHNIIFTAKKSTEIKEYLCLRNLYS